jgi:hypothetical protein
VSQATLTRLQSGPAELILDPGFELSVRTDRVSIEYRRWLHELVDAVSAGRDAVRTVLQVPTPVS